MIHLKFNSTVLLKHAETAIAIDTIKSKGMKESVTVRDSRS